VVNPLLDATEAQLAREQEFVFFCFSELVKNLLHLEQFKDFLF
jgi:hypothetical protein